MSEDWVSDVPNALGRIADPRAFRLFFETSRIAFCVRSEAERQRKAIQRKVEML